MDTKSIMEALQAPFPQEDIEWRVGSTNKDKTKGLALAYVTNRAIQNRLDEVFGPFGWQNQFKEWKQGSQLCGISIKFEDEWITKWDGADDSNQEAIKGGLSDSMKRAAYQWGIGRYLYKLPKNWVEIEPAGHSYKIKRKPSLPAWALPKGAKPDEQPTQSNVTPPEPTAAIKSKWELIGGKPEVLNKWFFNQMLEGKTVEEIDQLLTKQLEEKRLMEQYDAKVVDERKGA
ncbi:Rad52/Rad22 family DNA repair protein [Aneurinibacillus migulanus]|uniref:Rad52/Rad22 family DNA repair protein n=1 Tax=Aneurinibacillus migulanus TaxID=47500 RepID=UPI0020A12F2E|nr:Rad52/Rad22 family DNA repair protein [Aneurinibacillus migulanus]MCP1355045.1 Rad52/Rad22 family DNA repair protein [Aneurinibacillus migulanus]